VVNFSFILVQNYSPYNLTFTDISTFQFNRATLKGKNFLNFWGIQTIKKAKSASPSFLNLTIDSAVATDSNILAIKSFASSSDLAITGLLLIDNLNIQSLNCGLNYYSPLKGQCLVDCDGFPAIWNTTVFSYKYCLDHAFEGVRNDSYVNNNL
jgi:hypothetical protein